MNRAGRIALDVGVGMGAVVAVTLARRAATARRLDEGQPATTRRMRRLQKQRARSEAAWADANLEALRGLLTASEKASVQLAAWDNARRTSEAMLGSAEIVAGAISADTAARRSRREALRTKVVELQGDAGPYLEIASQAQSELAKGQQTMRDLYAELRRGAPTEVSGPTRRLVAAHDAARRVTPGTLDERWARQRLDEVAALRESLEVVLARLIRA